MCKTRCYTMPSMATLILLSHLVSGIQMQDKCRCPYNQPDKGSPDPVTGNILHDKPADISPE